MSSLLAGFSSKGMPTLPFSCRFIEIGVNLMDEQYQGVYNNKQKHAPDLLQVLERAKSCGVMKSIITASTLEESINALALARGHDELYSTVGIHPTRSLALADPIDATNIIQGLRTCILDGKSDGRVVALGECGLDYDRLHFSPKEAQLIAFDMQLDLAAEVDLPMFLHNRNTEGDFVRVLQSNREKITRGGVVHSFDGSVEEMHALVEMGLYIGINGCSLKTEENLSVAREIPLHRLLLETDAPWCTVKPTHAGYRHLKSDFPKKKNDKYEIGYMVKDRNEPCKSHSPPPPPLHHPSPLFTFPTHHTTGTIIQILEIVAAIRDMDPVLLANAVYDNSEQLFFPTTPSSASTST